MAEIAAVHADLMIDALLGTGFKGELGGNYKRACLLMNGARADVLAVDIPSGAQADTGEADENAVQAAATVTMQLPKRALFISGGGACGQGCCCADWYAGGFNGAGRRA